jgi:SAM-dependent methyltransferase
VNSINCYEDGNRASAYATLEFANTYYLAFRDLPEILSAHVTGVKALDFGCGTGRSTRVLKKLGFDVTGVDISEDMLRIARTSDPSGDYRLVPGDNLNQFAASSFDLVLCAFPFDNVPGGMKARIFRDLRGLLAPTRQNGRRDDLAISIQCRSQIDCRSGARTQPRDLFQCSTSGSFRRSEHSRLRRYG